ncbi:MAG: methyl viologen-reducing hydrogenase [Desulfobulbaceae bacterium]|nr:methyl viologen-reducing hydrogenase [Desulfobulbaceae bacterium]
MNIRLAAESLHSCSGCEISLLNIGEALIPLLNRLQLVHLPLLMDHKYSDPAGSETEISIPKAEIGLVSGGVANTHQLQVLEAMRKSCTTLVALGTCGTHGGIPAMINEWPMADALQTVFSTVTTEPGDVPNQDIPPMLDRVYSLDEKTDVDIFLPGCPPDPTIIARVLEDFLDGLTPEPVTKSVCDTCPTRRTGKSERKLLRFTANARFDSNESTASMQCLLEQGFLCMGPVTAGGCGHQGEPACIRARVPCRGCYGPVRHQDNQMLGMLNGLVSQGIDFKTIIDRKSMLRFSGAHGRLRPLKEKKRAS